MTPKNSLNTRQALANMSEAVADFARRTWSWEACVEAYAGIIKQLVAPTEKAPQ